MIKTARLADTLLTLERYPETDNASLQAWDAADELLLGWLSEADSGHDSTARCDAPRILVINDQFGALTCSLSEYSPVYYNDSKLAEIALMKNLGHNKIDAASVQILDGLESLGCLESDVDQQHRFDLILIKVPKQLNYLDYLLHSCIPLMSEDARLIVAGMTRQMPPALFEMVGRLFSRTESSRAVKKARLLFLDKQNAQASTDAAPTDTSYSPIETEEWEGLLLLKHPNTFARKKIDSGSALLASFIKSGKLPGTEGACRILDIGCGNGLLALSAASRYPDAHITAIDESRMAVRSAKDSFNANAAMLQPGVEARFLVMDAGQLDTELPRGESFDVILCNPPFHQHGTVNRKLALRLLLEAGKRLTAEGSIYVVSNTSLGYHGVLTDHFRVCRIVMQKAGYTICRLQS
ncbi:methyltransferase [Spirochaeta dissipatitropha]